jgi:uncharacterized protein YceK
MNKTKSLAFALLVAMSMSGCATILGGPISDQQTRKPRSNQRKRDMRVGYFALDIICGVVPLFVDMATGAIYKPPRNSGE